MFVKPLLTVSAAEDFVKENPYSIIFLPSSSASGYLEFKAKTDQLVLMILECGKDAVKFSALAIDAVFDFKEKKEIFIDEGVAFFIGKELSIANKNFDPDDFAKSLKKFKTPAAATKSSDYSGYDKDYNCSCCVIL